MNKEERKAKRMEKKSAKREKRARWKELKAAERMKLKERYADAPGIVRVFRVYLLKPVVYVALAIVVICAGVSACNKFMASEFFEDIGLKYYNYAKTRAVSEDVILEQSPIDEAGAAVVDAFPDGSDEDTWTICVYMIGSNLESNDENDLSMSTVAFYNDQISSTASAKKSQKMDRLYSYKKELEKNGLDLPEFLYQPITPVASVTPVTDEVVVAKMPGCASNDIDELCHGVYSDNIKIVFQTGGAKRWSNSRINPNKTQRFEYVDGYFNEVDNMPLQDSCDPKTLSDFMAFCDKNYAADHMILVLWDHGSGAQGYGSDEIFGTSFTLPDLEKAFAHNYKKNSNNPHWDLIGFDACLMASVEVPHYLSGYTRYMVASEELEPGDGWNYTPVMDALNSNPAMSVPDFGRLIADEYINYYITYNENVAWLIGGDMAVEMSLIDVNEAEKAYQAYCQLAKTQLKDAVKSIDSLTTIDTSTNMGVRYGNSYYSIINEIDLGTYMDALSDYYPQECDKVRNAVKKSVLYHRENGFLSESQGLSVYVPTTIDNINGIATFLEYLDNACDNDDVRALYYYKASGCLNDKLKKYVSEQGMGTPKTLDVSVLRSIGDMKVSFIDGGNYQIPVSEELRGLISGHRLELASYDTKKGELVYYGHDNYTTLEDEGYITTDFDGKWIALDDEFLYVEPISETYTSILYRSPIKYNGEDYFLIFSYDKDSETFAINGIFKQNDGDDLDDFNVADRKTETLMPGDKIVPLLKVQNVENDSEYISEGKTIKYKSSSKVEMKSLDNGEYLSMIVIEDMRGDTYYAPIVEQSISMGKVRDQSIDMNFVGSAY